MGTYIMKGRDLMFL